MRTNGFSRFFLPFLVVVWASLLLPAFAGPQTNTIPWNDNFENYTNSTPLIEGTNGWYGSSYRAVISTNHVNSGNQAAMIPIDVTLSNRFADQAVRIVQLQMYIRPQLHNGSNAPAISSNVAAQFYINSNGHFVVGKGINWHIASALAGGGDAIPITSSNYTRVEVNFRYKNHTWNLKAWSNATLVASTVYMNFTSNLNTFNGFDYYNGNSTSYVDDVVATNIDRVNKINGIRVDAIRLINGAEPSKINGVDVNQ